jgi:hypothetical protein
MSVENPAPDPNCLHCLLGPLIERFAVEKDLSTRQVIVAVTQCLGEFIATVAPPGTVRTMTINAALNLADEAHKAATDFAARGLREGAS